MSDGDDEGVRKETIQEGNEMDYPTKGDECAMHCDGREFDNSRKKKGKVLYKCEIGGGKIIRGFAMGLQMMSVGERARIFIPSSYAYGKEGVENMFPPDTDLIFEVDLYRINGSGFYTSNEKKAFKSKMIEWKEKQLKKYDDNETYREKKKKKHADRRGFVEFLKKRVEKDVAAVRLFPTETDDELNEGSEESEKIDTGDLDDIDN
eukprot:g393.t1